MDVVRPPDAARLAQVSHSECGPDLDNLPRAEFAFPGPLRDKLVAAILSGHKTATTSLAIEYEIFDDDPFPTVGARSVLIDSAQRPRAVLETTAVRVVRLDEVNLAHAVDEGEGHTTVAAWRADHEAFWSSADVRQALGDPHFTVDDATQVVLERFRVVRAWEADRSPTTN